MRRKTESDRFFVQAEGPKRYLNLSEFKRELLWFHKEYEDQIYTPIIGVRCFIVPPKMNVKKFML